MQICTHSKKITKSESKFSHSVYYLVGNFRVLPVWSEGVFTFPEREQQREEECKEHHIALVLGGYQVVNRASALFKSILYHHRVR